MLEWAAGGWVRAGAGNTTMGSPVHSPDPSSSVGGAEGAGLALWLRWAWAPCSGGGVWRKLPYPSNFYLAKEASRWVFSLVFMSQVRGCKTRGICPNSEKLDHNGFYRIDSGRKSEKAFRRRKYHELIMRKSALVSQSSDLPESGLGHKKKTGTHYQVALVQILRNCIFPFVYFLYSFSFMMEILNRRTS